MSVEFGAPSAPPRRAYVPAIGPKLRRLLWVVFGLVGLIGANSAYLAAVTFLEWRDSATYQEWFYQMMFLGHLVLGLVLAVPFLIFAGIHMWNTRRRKNKRVLRVGYALFAASLIIFVTGLLLVRVGSFDLRNATGRSVVYWLHVGAPLVCLWLYGIHRLAGPRIKWRVGLVYGLAVLGVTAGLIAMHNQDPRTWNTIAPQAGAKYFEPSLARTATGNFIPADVLTADDYCLKCHKDAYEGWFHSAHHFSSFNNPAYLASVRETREVSLKRDGNVQASRWCAGCHDPAPFFSGAFDDPKFDDVNHPTAQAGITCTTCHSIVHVNSTRGNADFIIEEPQHYPFAFSDNPALQWISNQLVKAKPAMHKKTFLKDFHKSAEFCSTCHKVHIPGELNHYKDFLRGQNHYDSYLLSGVSGHGARSFYYPEKAVDNCAKCHMPLAASGDFGAKNFDGAEKPSIHSHLFPSANTGIAWWKDIPNVVDAHREFLQEKLRIDIFGLHEGDDIDAPLTAPLRPSVPTLTPGKPYVLDTVVRTLKMGHPFTQGTVDSNEVWLDVTLTSGGKVIGRSGAIDEGGHVDPWSHFINVFMLDREGNRIDRRNPQDIFVPLYNHQIPPGAAATVHYGFQLPEDVTEPVTIEVKLQYRKFDQTYLDFITKTARPGDLPIRGHEPGKPYINPLPIVTMCSDTITLPVAGSTAEVKNPDSKIPLWQRWNDYGIGLLLKGKAELAQAGAAFEKVEELKRFDGPLNLARVYYAEGRLDDATAALNRALAHTDPPAPPWTVAWLTGSVNREQGNLEEAEANFRKVLEDKTPEMIERGFDFSLDIEVRNLLGLTLFDRARQMRGSDRAEDRKALLEEAVRQFQKTLDVDSEDVTAHYQLQLLYAQLGDEEKSKEHRELHARYKVDDNARDKAVAAARKKYPAGNRAAEAIVIYRLNEVTP